MTATRRSVGEKSAARYWPLTWAVLVSLSGIAYLLPTSFPGERSALILCQALLWAGAAGLCRRNRFLLTTVLLVAAVQFFPVRSGLTRFVLILGLGGIWAIVAVTRRDRRMKIALIAAPAAAGAILMLGPGRRPNVAALREEYMRSLGQYRGAVYIWGGETRIGIDCSGLVRCGWIDANLREGLRTANPGLIRTSVVTWWQDCSAKELGIGYRGRTRFVLDARSLNEADYKQLLPGDIAVSESGVHTLAYLGNGAWIEAEPILNGVEIRQAPEHQDVWFATPMRVVRWRELDLPTRR